MPKAGDSESKDEAEAPASASRKSSRLGGVAGAWQQIFGDFVHEAIDRASLAPRCPDTPSLDPHYQTYTLLLSPTRSSSSSKLTLPQLTVISPRSASFAHNSSPIQETTSKTTIASQILQNPSNRALHTTTPSHLDHTSNALPKLITRKKITNTSITHASKRLSLHSTPLHSKKTSSKTLQRNGNCRKSHQTLRLGEQIPISEDASIDDDNAKVVIETTEE